MQTNSLWQHHDFEVCDTTILKSETCQLLHIALVLFNMNRERTHAADAKGIYMGLSSRVLSSSVIRTDRCDSNTAFLQRALQQRERRASESSQDKTSGVTK